MHTFHFYVPLKKISTHATVLVGVFKISTFGLENDAWKWALSPDNVCNSRFFTLLGLNTITSRTYGIPIGLKSNTTKYMYY